MKGDTNIFTDNGARNAPMLAINTKLGFRRLPGHFGLGKALADQG